MAIWLNCLKISRRLSLLLLLEIIHTAKYIMSFCFSKDLIFKISLLMRNHRRLVFLCCGFVVLCIYSLYILLPVNYSFGFSKEYVETSSLDVCINDRIASYATKLGDIDAVRYQDHSHKKYFSFIGNGYFGVSKDADESILISNNKSLSVVTKIYPFISLNVPDYLHKENTVLDFLAGLLVTFQCYKQSSLCISITSTSYAHRSRRQLLVQEIRVHNPTRSAVQIAVKKDSNKNEDMKLIRSMRIKTSEFEIFVRNVTAVETSKRYLNKTYVVAYIRPVFPRYLSIPLTGDNTFLFLSGIEYKLYIADHDNYQAIADSLIATLIANMKEAHNKPTKDLRFEHETIWKSLWNTGISTDKSLAPGALNGHQINSTIYYLLSNSQAYMDLKNISIREKDYYESFLYKAFHCYNAHDTLYVTNLWSLITTRSDFISQTSKWMITLYKYGCGSLIKSGAHGLIQAIVYSAGSFNFVGDHISFGMHPNDLQRKLRFRNLQYKTPNATKFNVLVDLDQDNRPQLWVSVSDKNKILYACDAGCVDAPVTLGKSYTQLPVKLTVPRYPILYISDQLSHIFDLKQVINFGQIEDAKAHNHQLISLHKHGHSWGGLPPVFWICIILLVVFFHAFLCKIIYSEYCRYKNDYDFSISNSDTEYLGDRHHKYVPSTRRSQYYKGLN